MIGSCHQSVHDGYHQQIKPTYGNPLAQTSDVDSLIIKSGLVYESPKYPPTALYDI